MCGPKNAPLSASGSNGSYFRYDAPQNGNLLFTGTAYTPFVASTDTFYVAGASNDTSSQALSFDGSNDYVALDMFYSSGIVQVTAEVWVRTSESGTGSNNNWAIIDFDRSEYYNLFVRGDNGRVGFATTSTNGIRDFYGPPGSEVNDGTWHHIAGVYDGTNKYIYVDGVLVATDLNTHNGNPLGTNAFRYGFIGDGSEADVYNGNRNNLYYDGDVRELRIWSIARTGSQILAKKNICLTGQEPNLEAYYTMDDGPGSSTLTDLTGNGHNGVLFNMNVATAWISDGQEVYCSCGQSDRDMVMVTVNPIVSGSVAEVSCPGALGTAVRMQGGNGSGNYDYRELSGTFAYSGGFQATPIIQSLPNGGSYDIEVQDENACLDTITGIVTSAAPTSIALSTSTDSCNVFSGGDIYYITNASNEVIAAVQSVGDDLGMITAQVTINPNAGVYSGEAFLGRNYLITPENQPAVSADIRLYFSAAEYSDLQDSATGTMEVNDDVLALSDLGVTKYNGPTEDAVFDPTDATSVMFIPQTGNGVQFGNNYIDLTVPGFSEFWINASTASAVLPVDWLSFSAIPVRDEVLLEWSTATESNSDYFVIERSTNGADYRELGIMGAMNTSNTTTDYVFKDPEPLNGVSFYRLRQVDLDGKIDFSEVRTVSFEYEVPIVVYPNPNDGYTCFVQCNDCNLDDLTVSAFDHLGGKVDPPISLSHQSENLVEVVFTQRLAMGVYTLVLETGLMTYKDKLVVKL